MKQKIKYLWSKTLISIVMLSMALTACGQPTKEGSGDGVNTPRPGSQGEEENVVITFTADEWLRSTYEPLMEEFHRQNPNISVQFAPIPQSAYESQTEPVNFQRLTATTADTGITWIAGSQIAEQYFLDLQPLMEGDPGFDPADFWDGSLESCQDAEGRSLGIPTSIQVNGIFYDDEAFAGAGFPEPHPGWTWDDFRGALTAVSKQGSRYGYAEQSHNTILIPRIEGQIALAGGEIDVEKMQQEVQWYLDLVDQEVILPPMYAEDADSWNKQWEKWQEMFASPERPVMWVGSLADSFPGAEWVNDEENPFANSAINVDGFAPFPVSADNPNEKTSLAYTQCLAVSKGSLNPKAAWAWVNFLSQQWTGRGKTQMWDLMQVPARKSTVEANNYWDVLPEKAVPAIKFALEHAWYQPGSFGLETSVVIIALVKDAAGFGNFSDLLALAKEDMPEIIQPTPDSEPVVVATVQATTSPDAEVINYFANLDTNEVAVLGELVQRYNEENPDQVIKLTTQLDVQGDWFPTLIEQFDCFYWYNLDPSSQDQDKVLPLDSFFSSEGSEFTNDFNPELLKSFTSNGQLYGLPVASDFQMMAYNKDLLASKGLTLPKNDWTFEDFTKMLELIGGGDESERTYGYLMDYWDESLFNSRDVEWADLEVKPPVPMLNSEDMVAFTDWIVALKDSGGIMLQTPENYMEVSDVLRSGRIAFFRTNASRPKGWYFSVQEAPFEIGVVPFPPFDDPTGSFFLGIASGQMISREAENPQACWDWFTFLSEQPTMQLGVPARLSVMQSSAWEAVVGKEIAEAMRVGMKNLRSPEPDLNYDPTTYPLSSWRNEALQKALEGEDVKTVLDSAQQKSETYLQCLQGSVFDQSNEDTIRIYTEKLRSCAIEADPEGSMWR